MLGKLPKTSRRGVGYTFFYFFLGWREGTISAIMGEVTKSIDFEGMKTRFIYFGGGGVN